MGKKSKISTISYDGPHREELDMGMEKTAGHSRITEGDIKNLKQRIKQMKKDLNQFMEMSNRQHLDLWFSEKGGNFKYAVIGEMYHNLISSKDELVSITRIHKEQNAKQKAIEAFNKKMGV